MHLTTFVAFCYLFYVLFFSSSLCGFNLNTPFGCFCLAGAEMSRGSDVDDATHAQKKLALEYMLNLVPVLYGPLDFKLHARQRVLVA